MSLMQLLTASRSLGTIKDQPSRYKMTEQNLLPKFGQSNRSEGTAAQMTQTAMPKVAEVAPAPPSREQMSRTKKEMSSEAWNKIGPDQKTAVASTAVPKPAVPARRWPRIRNPFAARKTVEIQCPTTQGELSLDLVKPVRNDLNDADLELVVRHKRPVNTQKGISASAARQEAAGCLWSRLSSRLFRTQQL